jgi:putative ABC transport system permease protein
MFKRYVIIAFRNLLKQKLFAFINIFGLAISMSVCLIALMGTREQFSYDSFHPYPQRTYRITSPVKTPDGRTFHLAGAPLPLAGSLLSDYGIADQTVRLYNVLQENASAVNGKKDLYVRGAFSEPSFFKVFGFKLEAGNVATALTAPNSIVLSRTTAARFFGKQNAIGRVLHFDSKGDYIVTGVLQDPPVKSHIEFDAIASISSVPSLEKSGVLPERMDNWNDANDSYIYALLKPGIPAARLESALTNALKRYDKVEGQQAGSIAFEPQLITQITPTAELYNDINNGTTWGKLLAVIGITFIILLSACFNYTNLSIVRSLYRAKEVGVRKVIGAYRYQIFVQFITESVIMALLSLVFAMGLLWLIMQSEVGREFIPDTPMDVTMFGWFVLFSIFTGLLAGAIPAWALSSFQPVRVLKSMSEIRIFGGLGLRKSLIVAQFVLSMVVTILVTTVYRQFHFKTTMDYGFKQKDILNIPLEKGNYALLKDRLLQVPGVDVVSGTSSFLGNKHAVSFDVRADREATAVSMNYFMTDGDFIRNMGLKLLAGSTFPSNVVADKEQYIIVNESALKAIHINTPGAAIGQTLWVNDSTRVNILGVVKDFNFQPIERPISPMALRYQPAGISLVQVGVNAAVNREQLLAAIAPLWKEQQPMGTFTYGWFDQELLKQTEVKGMIYTLTFLALMTIVIAGMGLLGIVGYTAQTRRKEISIRKIMGAGSRNLIMLLSGNYLKLIMISGLIALPLGFLAGNLFLQLFAYRVSLGIGTLLGSFLLLLGIALLAIISQTYSAVTTNPVNSLRND